MVTEKIQLLAELKAKAAKLEASLGDEIPAALAALPETYGYDSLASFIKALKQSVGHKRAKPGRKPKDKAGKAAKPVKHRKGKRAKITEDVKAAIKAAFESGKKGGAIAKEMGISMASVQNVKKEFGLVKVRAKGVEAPAATEAPSSAPV